MLTLKEFVTELAREDLRLSSAEVSDLTHRFGDDVLQMGQLQEDGSMLVRVDCILEATRLLGVEKLQRLSKHYTVNRWYPCFSQVRPWYGRSAKPESESSDK